MDRAPYVHVNIKNPYSMDVVILFRNSLYFQHVLTVWTPTGIQLDTEKTPVGSQRWPSKLVPLSVTVVGNHS